MDFGLCLKRNIRMLLWTKRIQWKRKPWPRIDNFNENLSHSQGSNMNIKGQIGFYKNVKHNKNQVCFHGNVSHTHDHTCLESGISHSWGQTCFDRNVSHNEGHVHFKRGINHNQNWALFNMNVSHNHEIDENIMS